jgi:hypothetical protein
MEHGHGSSAPQRLDYSSGHNPRRGRRGIAAMVVGLLGTTPIALFLVGLKGLSLIRNEQGPSFIAGLFWTGLALVVFLALPLFPVSVGMTIWACRRGVTRVDLPRLAAAWLMVILQSCFWAWAVTWICGGGLRVMGGFGSPGH